MSFKFYADDGSFFFNFEGLKILVLSLNKGYLWCLKELLQGNNLFLSLLNNLPLFKRAGVKLCPRKSSLVRLNGIWLKPYTSLGLRLSTPLNYLQQLLIQIRGGDVEMDLNG
jgi:hypothetical protein